VQIAAFRYLIFNYMWNLWQLLSQICTKSRICL